MFRSDQFSQWCGLWRPVLTPVSLWNYTTGDYVDSSPAVVNGVVYVGSDDGIVYALSAATGAKLWNYTAGYYDYVDSSPAVVGGVVYVGSDDGNVYALNAANGVKLWNYTVGSAVDSSPAVVNGVVYIGSEVSTSFVRHLSLVTFTLWRIATGAELWNYPTNGGVVFVSRCCRRCSLRRFR